LMYFAELKGMSKRDAEKSIKEWAKKIKSWRILKQNSWKTFKRKSTKNSANDSFNT
jgi:ABC-type uncharacterized transport system ATPase subunit